MKFKILIDENLPRRLNSFFNEAAFDSTHVALKNLLNSSDIDIWNFAYSSSYTILTKDWDYRFLSITLGCPPKVIRLNCGNKTTAYIRNLLREKLEIIWEFLDNQDDCYLEIG